MGSENTVSVLDGGEWSSLGWALQPVCTRWRKEKNPCPLPGIEPQSTSP